MLRKVDDKSRDIIMTKTVQIFAGHSTEYGRLIDKSQEQTWINK